MIWWPKALVKFGQVLVALNQIVSHYVPTVCVANLTVS